MMMNQKIRNPVRPELSGTELNIDISSFIMAMDRERVHEKLAKVLFPAEGFDLMVKRAFPWSKPGKGLIEYEITMDKNGEEPRILNAQLNQDGKCMFHDSIKVDFSPLNHVERDLFIKGIRSISLTEPNMTISTFPLDYRMHKIRELLDPGLAVRVIGTQLCQALNAERLTIDGQPKLLGYRFGKRCTLLYRIHVQDRTGNQFEIPVVGKIHHDDKGRDIFDTLKQLWNWQMEAPDTRPCLISSPLCYIPEYRIYFLIAQGGSNLFDLESGPFKQDVLSRTGVMLSSFHRSRLTTSKSYSPEDELNLLRKWIGYLWVIFPELRVLSGEILSQIHIEAEKLSVHSYRSVITHRDFFDKQIIIDGDYLFMIDLDTVAMSDPAIDVGNFVSHLFLRAFQRGETRQVMNQESKLFMLSYLSQNPGVSLDRIRFYTATTLFRLACLYAYRPRWNGLSLVLLEECRQRLRGK
jgi:hypothetical protein